MSIKALIFIIIFSAVYFTIPAKAQQVVGYFAIGWMLADIVGNLFPKKGKAE